MKVLQRKLGIGEDRIKIFQICISQFFGFKKIFHSLFLFKMAKGKTYDKLSKKNVLPKSNTSGYPNIKGVVG